jgi:hypothetical protein
VPRRVRPVHLAAAGAGIAAALHVLRQVLDVAAPGQRPPAALPAALPPGSVRCLAPRRAQVSEIRSVREFMVLSRRICAALGLSSTAQSRQPESGLAALAGAEPDVSGSARQAGGARPGIAWPSWGARVNEARCGPPPTPR